MNIKDEVDPMKWSYAHFPVGTICEVEVVFQPKQIVEVTGIYSCNLGSYVITTNSPGRCTEFFSVNIGWVTRIIKRGSGPLKFVDAGYRYSALKIYEDGLDCIQGCFKKTKNQYAGTENSILSIALEKCSLLHVSFDYDKMFNLLLAQGVIQNTTKDRDAWFPIYVANKKRLNSSVKRLFSSCLVSLEKTMKEEKNRQYEEYERDLDDDDYDDLEISDEEYGSSYDFNDKVGYR